MESGFLKVLQLTAEGTELIMRFVAAGEPFGGVVALGDAPYPVTAIATPAEQLVHGWTRNTVSTLLVGTPQVSVNIMREMAMHMTDALTDARPRTDHRARGAAAARTPSSDLARRNAENGPLTACSSRSRSRARNSRDLTGTTLYTVSRTLTKWESMGLLESRKRLLLLRSLRRLEEVSGNDDD